MAGAELAEVWNCKEPWRKQLDILMLKPRKSNHGEMKVGLAYRGDNTNAHCCLRLRIPELRNR